MLRKALDSWAMMELLMDQPAAPRVEQMLTRATVGELELCMSWVNLGEVFYLWAKRRSAAEAEQFLAEFIVGPVRLIPAEPDLIIAAARWKSRHQLSYADAFAVETARREGAALVTGDPELRDLASTGVVQLDWIGP